MSLPVDQILPAVARSLSQNHCVVLQSPPGSGKTTRTAPFLLDAPWLAGRKILMLEPRRLAARAAASYMARCRGESVGESVGYRVRLENRVGPSTRIEVLTEGMLTQRLLHDPELSDTGLVIFDEFHERNLPGDFGLALALDVRNALRPDLRILVMSATLDPDAVATHLDHADVHTATGRSFPVETRYLRKISNGPLAVSVAEAVRRALDEERGSVLVFLPGEGEIRSTYEQLTSSPLPADVSLFPLYGALDRVEQDRAIAPSSSGKRKVVLATSIAESSLTIEGIRVVIDSGWMRVPRFSSRTGMARLETLRLTRDRADQRRGRAGRMEPGVCYRLWDEQTDRLLQPESLPEILDADLAPVVLQMAEWGTTDRLGIPWLTPPPEAGWRAAVALLQQLDALDSGTRPAITEMGHRLARYAAHPRLAYAMEQAARHGAGRQAAFLAAVVEEAGSTGMIRRETDVRRRVDLLRAKSELPVSRRVRQLADRWSGAFRGDQTGWIPEGLIFAWAFPERIARRRNAATGSYLLRNGRGAVLEEGDSLANEEWLVAIELQDGTADAKIRLAIPIEKREIQQEFGAFTEEISLSYWDKGSESVQSVRRVRLGALTIAEGNDPTPDMEKVGQALCAAIRQRGVDQLPWSKAARSFQERVSFLFRKMGEGAWPDFSDTALERDLEKWLLPFCPHVTKWSQLQKIDLLPALLTWCEQQGHTRDEVDRLAPKNVQVPSGSLIAIHYDGECPTLSVRIQEVFGMTRTPKVLEGRIPVVMHLLSPAQRPVQVTSDLQSFWATGYALVRKDLRGRYPKHYWPEDPTCAQPTRRVRPKQDDVKGV